MTNKTEHLDNLEKLNTIFNRVFRTHEDESGLYYVTMARFVVPQGLWAIDEAKNKFTSLNPPSDYETAANYGFLIRLNIDEQKNGLLKTIFNDNQVTTYPFVDCETYPNCYNGGMALPVELINKTGLETAYQRTLLEKQQNTFKPIEWQYNIDKQVDPKEIEKIPEYIKQWETKIYQFRSKAITDGFYTIDPDTGKGYLSVSKDKAKPQDAVKDLISKFLSGNEEIKQVEIKISEMLEYGKNKIEMHQEFPREFIKSFTKDRLQKVTDSLIEVYKLVSSKEKPEAATYQEQLKKAVNDFTGTVKEAGKMVFKSNTVKQLDTYAKEITEALNINLGQKGNDRALYN